MVSNNEREALFRRCRKQTNWTGAHYELTLFFHPNALTASDRLNLLRTLWQQPAVSGVVKEIREYGQPWQEVEEYGLHHRYYGCLDIDARRSIGCGSIFFPEEDALQLCLYTSMGMVDTIFEVDYMHFIVSEHNAWHHHMDRVLLPIALQLYTLFPFTMALIGEEVSSVPVERTMSRIATQQNLLAPGKFFEQHGVSPHGIFYPEGLWWTGVADSKK